MTVSCYTKLVVTLALQAVFFFGSAYAQPISFHHINTSNGLSDNNVRCVAVDKNGFLWIGTTDGLNIYDGYLTTAYYKDQEPEMASNNIAHLTSDSRNRTWLGTAQGVTWVDEKRKFHRVTLEDSIQRFSCATIQETSSYGIVLYTNLGQYYLHQTSGKWKKLDWIPEKLRFDKFFDAEPFSDDQIIYTTDSAVAILNYKTRAIIYEQPFYPPVSACKVSDDEIAVGLQTGRVIITNIKTQKIIRDYQVTNELNGKKINTNLSEVRCAANGDLIVATGYAGMVTISKTGFITSYKHDPVKPGSISSNNTYRVLPVSNGDIITGTSTSGVNIFNIYNKQAGYTPVFSDAKGELFDNFLDGLAEDKNHIIWIGAYDRLIRWDKKNNQSKYYYCYLKTPLQGTRNLEIRTLCFDKNGKLWTSTLGDGLAVFDEKMGSFSKIPHDTGRAPALRSQYVHDLLLASDGNIWACTNTGFYSINPDTRGITTYDNHPILKTISAKRTITIFEDRQKRLWFAVTSEGVYCFDPKSNTLKHFGEKDGLLSNVSYGFKQDKTGNIYAGSQLGFNIITPVDSIYSFTRENGLHYDRCEGFLEDDDGFMWISNNKCLIKYDPVNKTMEYFDENAGLSVYGFRFDCFLKTSDGEMLFGGQRGVNYFYTGQMVNNPGQLKVSIFQAILEDSTVRFSTNYSTALAYSKNNIQFHFTAINLRGSSNVHYDYMLEGYDKSWQKGVDITDARYTSLPPGKYTFKVRASMDMIHWTNASNEVEITIIPPIWQRWWFIAGILIALAAITRWFILFRAKNLRRQKEEIETQRAINYFASSMYEQQTVDKILWDVAKNCISRLHFEDCVIYLLDEKRGLLIQKAAHGPKNPKKFEIQQPIEIPLGKGIVGSVAQSGKGEIIRDTTKDARYIVDDELRYSEISVPIISDGKVLGVIDCEHSKKNFFTHKHFSILTTIASLCANKIVRARAEEERQQAEIVLLDTQRKMADMEMQALRAQMNPHFIFNCLNSINRYIVKSDQATASLYLTRFAKLIRLILENSNAKNVILSNELEALKLYIEMEALRFDKKFSYKIIVDDNVNPDSIEVPPLIIQPYVENAIWHGLLHKETGGQLNIYVSMLSESMLQCIIEDNGVGRAKAKELKSKSATTRKSLGMKLTEGRISLLNKHAELNASVDIIDLTSTADEPAGTKVILKIPV